MHHLEICCQDFIKRFCLRNHILRHDPINLSQRQSKFNCEMVNYSTAGQMLIPARSKKKRNRRKSRRSSISEESKAQPKYVTITLRDVGDIDDKELNTIPSSVEGETSSWGDIIIINKSNNLPTNRNPVLHDHGVNYCAECTKTLLDIHGNNVRGAGERCDHEEIDHDVRRKTVAQSLMNIFQSITEGRFDESKIEIVESKPSEEGHENNIIHKIMERKTRAISRSDKTSSKEVRCSMSTVSIQVMCTTESTLSSGMNPGSTNGQPGGQPETATKPEPVITNKNLETVAGALLIELCKATAEKINEIPVATQKRIMSAKDSHMSRIKSTINGQPSYGFSSLDVRLPDWLRELCQEEDSRKCKRGSLKKTRSPVFKSKINIFRPLLCTKLSLPWFLPKSLPPITCSRKNEFDFSKHKSSSDVKYEKLHHRNNTDRIRTKEDNSEESVRSCNFSCLKHRIVHAYSSRSVHYRARDSVEGFNEPAPPMDVPLRLFASKMARKVKQKRKELPQLIEDSTEDKDSRSNSHQDGRDSTIIVRKKRAQDICIKCKKSMQCSSAMKSIPQKPGRIQTKGRNVLAYPCRKVVKKSKRAGRLEKSRRQQHDNLRGSSNVRQYRGEPTTKYFIKSFFAGTTSTSETTKAPLKNTKKPVRRKRTSSAPRTSAGRRVVVDRKKHSPTRTPRKRAKRISNQDEIQSDIELAIQASEEMDIINEHIRAHRKASDSSPVYHTCFKRLVDKELKAHSGRDSKTGRSKKPTKCVHSLGGHQVEIKKFNEGIFSCFIPKVFK